MMLYEAHHTILLRCGNELLVVLEKLLVVRQTRSVRTKAAETRRRTEGIKGAQSWRG